VFTPSHIIPVYKGGIDIPFVNETANTDLENEFGTNSIVIRNTIKNNNVNLFEILQFTILVIPVL